MLSLFRNKKKQKSVIQNDSQDKIAKDIVVKCIRFQQRCAAFMQRHTEQLPGKWKLIMLFLFCVFFGGFSLLLIDRSLMSNHTVSFHVSQVKIPQHIAKSGDEKTKAIATVTKKEYERIQRFRLFIDSLARSPSGKKRYDSILNDRPGLIDSIILIENIFHSQTKK